MGQTMIFEFESHCLPDDSAVFKRCVAHWLTMPMIEASLLSPHTVMATPEMRMMQFSE